MKLSRGMYIPVGIVPLDGDPVLVAAEYMEEWVRDVSLINDIRFYASAEKRFEIYQDVLEEIKGPLGIEEHMPVKLYEQLTAALPHLTHRNVTKMLREARMIKAEVEIAAIRKAVNIVEQGIQVGREFIQEGITEKEIALEIIHTMEKQGAEDVPYYLVQTGVNATGRDFPPGNTRVEKGDFVLMDITAVFRGLHADITRMTIVGPPSPKQQQVYQVVLDAQLRAVEAIQEGVRAGHINEIGRGVIDEGGFSTYMSHGLGHGLGFEAHELPELSTDTDVLLQAGMVLTIEPGVYLPGEFGVRIEDDILITGDGKEVLPTMGKELIQV